MAALPFPPLNRLATMQKSSKEESDTYTRPTQRRVTVHVIRDWERHKNAAANGINNRSKTLNKLRQLQRIPAEVAAPLSVRGDDMSDNEDADSEPCKTPLHRMVSS